MTESIKLRGATLALEEATNKLIGRQKEDLKLGSKFQRSNDPLGEQRAEQVKNHIDLLEDAYGYWVATHDYFQLLKKEEKEERLKTDGCTAPKQTNT